MSETNDALLELLVGKIKDDTKGYADKQIEELKAKIEKDMADIQVMVENMVKQAKETVQKCGHIVNLGTIEKPQFEKTHSAFDKILKVLSSSKRKEKNIMLVGGAGGGKTHLVKQIADSLKLPFYPMSVGLQTTKSDLLGFINATGTYMPSCIRQAYENGGVLLLDEFDAAHAGVVTILNSLLANGHCSFPDKVIDKHKDFICLVACNTFGTGANMEYIGRNRLDGATLDRFITIEVGYDEDLEKDLTGNENWYNLIKDLRYNAEKQGVKQIISPRASMDGADLLDAGFDIEEVLNMTVFKGCSKEIQNKLLGSKTISGLRERFANCPQLETIKKRHRRTKEEMKAEEYSDDKFDYIVTIGQDGIATSKADNILYNMYRANDDILRITFGDSWAELGLTSDVLYLPISCETRQQNRCFPFDYGDYIKFFEKIKGNINIDRKCKFIVKGEGKFRVYTLGV